MIRLIGKLIKFVIILLIIAALFVGACFVGSEVFDIDFCEEVIEEIEDIFDGLSSESRPENDQYRDVLPECTELEEINLGEYENKPDTVASAYKDKGGSGYVIVLETSTSYTSSAEMSITVGISTDGVIKGVTLNEYSETKDFGKDTYPQTFVGLSSEDIDTSNNEHLVSGVTYSSKAFKAAIKDALNFAAYLDGGEIEPLPDSPSEEPEIPRDENEVISLAENLIGSDNLTRVDISGCDYLKRLYRDEHGAGYVAYLVVISENYGTVETETLVHIGNDAKIIGIEKLTWKTSDAIYGYEPPTPEAVDEFYGRLVGAGTYELHYNFMLDGAELVSGATNTSKNLVESLYEALSVVENLNK